MIVYQEAHNLAHIVINVDLVERLLDFTDKYYTSD